MQTFSMQQDFTTTSETIWSLVGNFNSLPQYIEAVTKSVIDSKATGTVRTLTLTDGSQLAERLLYYDTEVKELRYTLLLGPLPVQNYVSTIKVTGTTNGCSVLWSCSFEPDGVTSKEAIEAVKAIYQMGFKGLSSMFPTNPN